MVADVSKELVDITVKTLTYILQALSSYLSRDSKRSKLRFLRFTSVIPGKCREATIRPRQIHSKSFPININFSSYSSPLYGLGTGSGYFVFNEAVSIENNGVSDRMLNEYGAVGGMRIGRGSRVIGEDPTQCHVFHNKSRMTWN